MNDTGTRLRDYLQTAAATVADTDQGPGLETAGTAHRRRWPVVLAAAAIAAILVLTASFLTRVLPDRSGPAEEPIPPLTDAAPRVPYTVRNGLSSTLYDGTQQVRIPTVDGTFLFWRAGGGWLGSQTPERGQFQAGILRPDGTFRPLGPVRSELPTPSPDRKQVALMHYLPNGQGEIVVVDVKSGREKAHTLAFQGWPALLGWNRTGIWFSTGDPSHPQLVTWKPGSGQPREITVPHFDGGLSAPAASGSISLSTRNGDARCLQTGTLRDGRFEVLREYCDRGAQAIYPVLSSDGRTMIHSQLDLAIDIATGKATKLQVPDPIKTFPQPVFENAVQLLVITDPPARKKPATPALYRCDVTTGECKLLEKDATSFTLHRP